MVMQSTDIAAQAVAILGSVIAGGATIVQGVTTKIIGDLVSERLRRDGHEDAWSEFLKDPQNNSLVRHLIREAVQQDQGFRKDLEIALQGAAGEVREAAAQRVVDIKDSNNVQLGIGNTITNSIRKRIINRRGGGAVVVALVALVLSVKFIGEGSNPPKDGGLSANSTCHQLLNADSEVQRQALADIGISEGLPGYSGPFSYWTVDGACGSQPNAKIGVLIKQLGNP